MILDQNEKSRELINSLHDIVTSLPNYLNTSQELTKDTENGIKDINQSNNQCKYTLNEKNNKSFL